MIPLRDDTPSRTVPFVTYLLIAINVLVFAWQVTTPEARVYSFYMIPAEVTSGYDLPPVHSFHPLYLTIFSAMFMHGSLLHIGGNMLYLWIFGDNVEDMLGHAPYLLFYLACGVAAAAAQIVVDPTSQIPTLGASGAIAGVLGAYLITHPDARVLCIVILGFFWKFMWLPAWLVLGGWIVIQIVNQTMIRGHGSQGGVAYMAHIGGFFAGMILFFVFGGKKSREAGRSASAWE